MLKKLLKYEFKATGRILWPLYALLILITIINKIICSTSLLYSLPKFLDDNLVSIFEGITRSLVMITYVIVMVAVFVVTFFIIIQRFYKNLLGDEGYLMNTLPAKTGENIVCKIISGMVWSFVSLLVAGVSIFIMAWNKDLINDLIKFISNDVVKFLQDNGAVVYSIVILAIILIIIQALSSIIMIYCSMSIGHLCNKRRILASFGAYIGLYFITNTVFQILTVIFFEVAGYESALKSSSIILMLIICIIFYSLFFTLFYVITKYIMKNKLNLQ